MLVFTSAVKDWSSLCVSELSANEASSMVGNMPRNVCITQYHVYGMHFIMLFMCMCRAFKRVPVFTAHLSSSLIKVKLFSSPLIVAVATSQQADLSQTHTHTHARKKSRAFNRK